MRYIIYGAGAVGGVIGALALEGLLAPVQGAIDEVLRFLPNVFAAGLILLIGWLVGRFPMIAALVLMQGAFSSDRAAGYARLYAVRPRSLARGGFAARQRETGFEWW